MKIIHKLIILLVFSPFLYIAETQAQFFNPWWMGPRTPGFWGMPFVSYETRGSYFLNDDWLISRITLRNDTVVEGYYMRYDLEFNRLEVDIDQSVKMLDLKQVKSFELYEPKADRSILFLNGFDFLYDGVPLVGIYEVVTGGGPIRLFSKIDVDFYRSNYRSGWSMFRMEEGYRKSEKFYLNFSNQVYPITKNAKENLALFNNHAGAVEQYMKQKKLGFKKRNDLIEVVRYFNTLL